jgi:uncharacterized delta-60 repeat protein
MSCNNGFHSNNNTPRTGVQQLIEVPPFDGSPYLVNTSCGDFCYIKNPAVYFRNVPITANEPRSTSVGPFTYSISPDLPVGLSIDKKTGFVTGTPLNLAVTSTYTVTQKGPAGVLEYDLIITIINSLDFKSTQFGSRKSSDDAVDTAIQNDGKILVVGESCRDSTLCNSSDFILVRYNTDGSLDSSFNSSGVVLTDFTKNRDRPSSMAIQSDGKIVVAGRIRFDDGDAKILVARYTNDGSLDKTFNSKGFVTFGFSQRTDFSISKVLIQSDQKILVAGNVSPLGGTQNFDFILVQFTSEGQLDVTFNPNSSQPGVVRTNLGTNYDYCYDMALQNSDGKILMAGTVDQQGGGSNSVLVRFLKNGQIDTTFNSTGALSGAVFLNIDSYDTPKSIIPLNDGSILLAGNNTGSSTSIFFARFTVDGIIDSTFGTNGIVRHSTSPITSLERVYAAGDEGMILIGSEWQGSSLGSRTVLARFNTANGNLDTSFQTTGYFTSSFEAFNLPKTLKFQSDGKMIVVGTSNPQSMLSSSFYSDVPRNIFVSRYSSAGSIDDSFSLDGFDIHNSGGIDSAEYAHGFLKQKDGKLLIFGSTNLNVNEDFAIARFNVNGTPDSSFSNDGRTVIGIGNETLDYAKKAVEQTDGRILVVGSSLVGQYNSDISLVRLNIDGSLDTTFNSTGKVTHSANCYDPQIVLLANEKIILACPIGARFLLLRYNSDGSVDTTLNGSGEIYVSPGAEFTSLGINQMLKQSDDKVIIGGYGYVSPGYTKQLMLRVDSNGMLDSTLNGTGIISSQRSPNSFDTISALAIQTDGKILVAGNSSVGVNKSTFLMRYNSNGSLDTGFSASGTRDLGIGIVSQDFVVSDIFLISGKILVGGVNYYDYYGNKINVFASYNSDGSIDKTFFTNGLFFTNFNKYFTSSNPMLVNPNNENSFTLVGTGGSEGSSDMSILIFR